MGLRESIAVIYLIFLLLQAVTLSAATNSTNITQIVHKIPPPPNNLFQEILSMIANGYNYLVNIIQNVLQQSLLKQDPTLADTYANLIAWLIPLTALYVLMSLIEVARKFLGYIIIAGWLFLIVVMFLAH
ncbi:MULTISPECIES: hypothetical protein [Sulfolobaceae]|uniref:Uncharacterized protein n=1 Tax=Sulfolobus tengchongensis TaxID=207809 RepID=Q6H0X6_9CREN|nr:MULTISPECIES: hypothetical protein [Sulfolobaceae]AAT46518.1 hypothetical protein [Sulfolobus tengchongensis]MCP6728446.1 hypothetical protein [Metallosphaera sedula]